MPRETKALKAARLITDKRVTVILANERGIWAHVQGDSGIHKAKLSMHKGRMERSCDCAYCAIHEITCACAHTEALTYIWRPPVA
jgi:hypothetical protein